MRLTISLKKKESVNRASKQPTFASLRRDEDC